MAVRSTVASCVEIPTTPRRKTLLQRRGALINVTGDASALSAAAPHISGFLSALPAEAGSPSNWQSTLARQNEALTVPTQVHLCGSRTFSVDAGPTPMAAMLGEGVPRMRLICHGILSSLG